MKSLKRYRKRIPKQYFLILLILSGALRCYTQVNEPVTSTVYEYLYRMAEKGLIRWNDYQLPLDRKAIASALDSLTYLKDHLSKTENRELAFHHQEYSFDGYDSQVQNVLFKKDAFKRLRAASFGEGSVKLFVDPLVGFQFLKAGDKNNAQYFSGVRLAGYFGKKWGFNFAFRDNTDKGDTLLHRSSFSPVEGTVPTITNSRLTNYSNINFNIAYRWDKGSISAGQENLSWGYGLSGNIALSGRAPSFPYIKFDFHPLHWLRFDYFHGWLQSNIIDSLRSYNTGTGIYGSRRELYQPKFIAHHAITVTPMKGLDIALGESMVYTDRLNFAYLIPINFFKIYDQYNSRYNINAGDNSQFFGFISSRNHLKNTHIYAQIFIDEIRASKVFNKRERRNQFAYTFGINKTDLFIPYLTAGIEYSRVNPFVYNNLIPAETYESHSYSLGDWMGNNADRLYGFVQYVPLPKLRVRISHQNIRKGESGTLEQQYNQVPQPEFLFKKLFDYKETSLLARYEWINRLNLLFEVNKININYTNAYSTNEKAFRFGINYGL